MPDTHTGLETTNKVCNINMMFFYLAVLSPLFSSGLQSIQPVGATIVLRSLPCVAAPDRCQGSAAYLLSIFPRR
jgi:hypothetical protein